MGTELGAEVRKLRERAGLTQAALAKLIDYSPSYVSKLENGVVSPPRDNTMLVFKLQTAFGLDQGQTARLLQLGGYAGSEAVEHPVLGRVGAAVHENPALAQPLDEFLDVQRALASATKAYEKGELDEADRAFNAFADKADGLAWRWRLHSRWHQATIAYRQGHIESAINLYQEALGHARRQGEVDLEKKILPILGDAYRRVGRWPEARSTYGEGLTLSSKSRDQGLEMECLRKRSGLLLFQGRARDALPDCRRSLALANNRLHDKVGTAKAMQHLGWALSYLGQLERSAASHKKALALAHEAGDERTALKGRRYLADAYRMLGRLDDAKDLYDEALSRCGASAATKGRLIEGAIKSGLANVYRALGENLVQARTLLQECLEIQMRFGEPYRIGSTLNDMGVLELAEGDPDRRAEFCFTRAREEFCHIGNEYYATAALVNLAQLYAAEGRYPEAEDTAMSAMRAALNARQHNHVSRAQVIVGECALAQGRLDEATSAYAKALHSAARWNRQLVEEVAQAVWQQANNLQDLEYKLSMLRILAQSLTVRDKLGEPWPARVKAAQEEAAGLRQLLSDR